MIGLCNVAGCSNSARENGFCKRNRHTQEQIYKRTRGVGVVVICQSNVNIDPNILVLERTFPHDKDESACGGSFELIGGSTEYTDRTSYSTECKFPYTSMVREFSEELNVCMNREALAAYFRDKCETWVKPITNGVNEWYYLVKFILVEHIDLDVLNNAIKVRHAYIRSTQEVEQLARDAIKLSDIPEYKELESFIDNSRSEKIRPQGYPPGIYIRNVPLVEYTSMDHKSVNLTPLSSIDRKLSTLRVISDGSVHNMRHRDSDILTRLDVQEKIKNVVKSQQFVSTDIVDFGQPLFTITD